MYWLSKVTNLEERIEEVARLKGNTLESSKELVFRFMNLGEFQRIMESGNFSGEANYEKTKFAKFVGNKPRDWDSLIQSFTHWDESSNASSVYQDLQNVYIRILNKYRSQKDAEQLALREFRDWILSYIEKLMDSSIKLERDGIDTNNLQIQDVDSAIQTIRKHFKIRSELDDSGSRTFYIPQNKDLITNLCNNQNYFVENADRLRDFLLSLSHGLKNRNDKHMSPIHRGKEFKPYQIVIFTTTQHFVDHTYQPVGLYRDVDWSWGYLGSKSNNFLINPGHVIGCLSIIPSRKLLQDVTDLVVEKAQQDPNNAFPVYNTKGVRFWPK